MNYHSTPRSISARQQNRMAVYSRRLNDGEHAALTAHCKRCHSVRPFYAWVQPDPQGAGQRRVEQMAKDWLAAHPCTASYVTNQGKQAAA